MICVFWLQICSEGSQLWIQWRSHCSLWQILHKLKQFQWVQLLPTIYRLPTFTRQDWYFVLKIKAVKRLKPASTTSVARLTPLCYRLILNRGKKQINKKILIPCSTGTRNELMHIYWRIFLILVFLNWNKILQILFPPWRCNVFSEKALFFVFDVKITCYSESHLTLDDKM